MKYIRQTHAQLLRLPQTLIAIAIILLIGIVPAVAQQETVQVSVVDSLGNHVPNIPVRLEGVQIERRANHKGEFMYETADTGITPTFVMPTSYKLEAVDKVGTHNYQLTVSDISVSDLSQLSFEELAQIQVVTSSRKLESINDAPNVMYVITAEEIKLRGYKSYKDILQTVPGFNVFHGDLGYVSQVRGIAPNTHNKVTYMINGRQINQYRETNMLTGPIMLDNAERVEIIVGPGSVLYGAETLLAIVNIITKSDLGNQLTVRAGQGFDSDSDLLGHRSGNLNLNKNWDSLRYINFSMTYLEDEGWTLFDTLELGPADNQKGKFGKVGSQYSPSYFICANARLDKYSIQYSAYNAELGELEVLGENGKKRVRIDEVNDFMIKHETQRTKVIDTRLQFNYAHKRTSRRPTSGFVGNATDLALTEYNFEVASNYKLGNHYIQTGVKATMQNNRFNYFMAINPSDPTDESKVQQFVEYGNTNQMGFYVSEKWDINKKLSATVASRFDYNILFSDTKLYPSPRMALVFKPVKFWVSKAMFNTSTHMPDPTSGPLNMIHGSDKPDTAPVFAQTNTLTTKPEKLEAYEFKNIFLVGSHRMSVNFFYQKLHDFISWFNPTTNMGDFTGYGTEVEWKGRLSHKVLTWANISYNYTDFTLTADQFNEESNFPSNTKGESLSVPKVTVNGGTDVSITESISISLTSKYFTEQATALNYYDTETGNREMAYTYVNNQFYLDASLLYENIAGFPADLNLSVTNIMDNRDKIGAQYRQYRYVPRGRIFYTTLRVRF